MERCRQRQVHSKRTCSCSKRWLLVKIALLVSKWQVELKSDLRNLKIQQIFLQKLERDKKKNQDNFKDKPRFSLKYLLWTELTLEIEWVAPMPCYPVNQWYLLVLGTILHWRAQGCSPYFSTFRRECTHILWGVNSWSCSTELFVCLFVLYKQWIQDVCFFKKKNVYFFLLSSPSLPFILRTKRLRVYRFHKRVVILDRIWNILLHIPRNPAVNHKPTQGTELISISNI